MIGYLLLEQNVYLESYLAVLLLVLLLFFLIYLINKHESSPKTVVYQTTYKIFIREYWEENLEYYKCYLFSSWDELYSFLIYSIERHLVYRLKKIPILKLILKKYEYKYFTSKKA